MMRFDGFGARDASQRRVEKEKRRIISFENEPDCI